MTNDIAIGDRFRVIKSFQNHDGIEFQEKAIITIVSIEEFPLIYIGADQDGNEAWLLHGAFGNYLEAIVNALSD